MERTIGDSTQGDLDGQMLPPERRDVRHWISTPTRPVGHSSGCTQKPPLSVVIVKEHTPSDHGVASGTQSVCSLESFGTHPGTTSPMSYSQLHSSASIIPSGAPFRLQPRGRSVSSPFSVASSRGQKRNAQCLNASSSSVTAGAKRELFPSTEESFSFDNSPQTYGERHPVVESAMESLSIKSPRVQHTDHIPQCSSSSRLPSRSFLGSSFISYSSSLAEGVNHIRPRADSFGSSTSSRYPLSPLPSSTKSSPRFAPVTILQKSSSAMGTPTKHRPPLHGGPSLMMLSHHDESVKSSGDDHSRHVLDTPRQPPQSVACSPPLSTVSTISKECTPAMSKRGGNPATPEYIPIIASPVAMRPPPHPSQSPCTPASKSVRSAHETPLPTVKLTPRTTPRSCSTSHRGGTTTFTSPHSARELGLLPIDLILDTSPQSRMCPCDSSQSNVSRNSTSKDEADGHHRNPPQSCSSYLPRPDWSDDGRETCSSPPVSASFRLPPRVPMKPPRSNREEVLITHGEQDFSAVHFTSLLSGPWKGGFFDELVCEQARAAAMDADGSLSDPDDDETFILTNPSTLAEECQSSLGGPARQKQRLSYNSMEQYNHRASSVSLLSGHASNTSLLGVGFVRGDSGTSLSRPLLGNNRSYSMKLDGLERTDEEQGGPSFPTYGMGDRSRSDNSMTSIGLELEPSSEIVSTMEGRDLSTPPAMEILDKNPPSQERGSSIPPLVPTGPERLYLWRGSIGCT